MNQSLSLAFEALEQSHVTIPYRLLTHYHECGLTDQDMMVVLHVLAFQQVERTFPALDELATRMSIGRDDVASILQRLLSENVIAYEQQGVSLRPLLERVFGAREPEIPPISLYQRFEDEFGRLLSPLEYEQITSWTDHDQYPDWLIIEALRESVLGGVYNFRYVDTILRGWARAHVSSEAQLAEYRKKFRSKTEDRTAARNGKSARTDSGARTGQSTGAPVANDRVVPAAQPGKYNRFYELYNAREEVASGTDITRPPSR